MPVPTPPRRWMPSSVVAEHSRADTEEAPVEGVSSAHGVSRRALARPPRPARNGGRRPMRAQTWRPWLLLAPAFVVLGVLLLAPLVRVFQLSFLDFGLRELVRGGAPFV